MQGWQTLAVTLTFKTHKDMFRYLDQNFQLLAQTCFVFKLIRFNSLTLGQMKAIPALYPTDYKETYEIWML